MDESALLDLPGLCTSAVHGNGRDEEVSSTSRTRISVDGMQDARPRRPSGFALRRLRTGCIRFPMSSVKGR